MEREKVIELAAQAGMNPNRSEKAINALFSSVPVHWLENFARLVEQETLERAAKHFDDRGRHIDGGWSEGWYEPQEPGEIIRGMINNRAQ